MTLTPDIKHSETTSQQDYSTKVFWFSLELIPLFAIPAIFGLLIHNWIQTTYPGTTFLYTVAVFAIAYTVSWVMVIKRYQHIKRQFKK